MLVANSLLLKLIHNIFVMKEWFSKYVKSLESLKEKAEFVERQARLLEDLLRESKARVAKLKEELQASQKTIEDLELQPKEKKKLANDMVTRLANVTSKGMYLES